MSTRPQLTYEFGDFCLIPADHLLLRHGNAVALTPKMFDALVLLVENHGHLVEKQQMMKWLWPDTFVEDVALAQQISQLRKVLRNGDGAGANAFIETVPKRGYRFVAEVRKGEGLFRDPPVTAPTPGLVNATVPEAAAAVMVAEGREQRRHAMQFAGIGFAALLLAGVAIFVATFYPSRVPRVVNSRPITHSGRVDPWGRVVTDGSRIYFLERRGIRWVAMQAPEAGGEAQPLPWVLPGKNFRVLDISPDHSQVLVGTFDAPGGEMPLWLQPVVGGAPVRLGNIAALDAAWSPSGAEIAYGHEHEVFISSALGGGSRKLASVTGDAEWLAWSHDGRRLRFSEHDPVSYRWTLWEVAADGSNLHRVLSDDTGASEGLGQWSADGRYFVFLSSRGGQSNLWARKEGSSWPRQRVQPLTAGPNEFSGAVVSQDSASVFVPVLEVKADVLRFDATSRRFSSFLNGVLPRQLNFSRDGAWMAYTLPDGSLWRSHPDGSERLQISAGPTQFWEPRISPDSKRIAFVQVTAGVSPRIFSASLSGGAASPLLPENFTRPDWSPDGKRMVCDSAAPSSTAKTVAIYIADLATEKLAMVPGSAGMFAARWSPDGNYLAALGADTAAGRPLMLFDFRRNAWRTLAMAHYPTIPEWSSDSRFLYYQDSLEINQPIYRINVVGATREFVADFNTETENRVVRAGFAGLAPNDAPVAIISRNLADIYRLQLDLP